MAVVIAPGSSRYNKIKRQLKLDLFYDTYTLV